VTDLSPFTLERWAKLLAALSLACLFAAAVARSQRRSLRKYVQIRLDDHELDEHADDAEYGMWE
jgi:hypothetical protein